MPPVTPQATVRDVAARLYDARRDRRPVPPVRHSLADGDLAAAYAVQRVNVARAAAEGRVRVGRKIGLTSEAVQRQLGVSQPDYGVLFEDMAQYGDDVSLELRGLISPRIEAEIAFVLGADVTVAGLPRAELAAAVRSLAAAAEIVDSAIAAWDIGIVDTIADNASCGAFVLGSLQPFGPGLHLPAREMRLCCEGVVVSRGTGAASLGDPLNALAWLADTAIAVGEPLRAGEVVLAGALGPMVAFEAATYRIEIEGFPPLTVRARP